jgi:hypothetical protein
MRQLWSHTVSVFTASVTHPLAITHRNTLQNGVQWEKAGDSFREPGRDSTVAIVRISCSHRVVQTFIWKEGLHSEFS